MGDKGVKEIKLAKNDMILKPATEALYYLLMISIAVYLFYFALVAIFAIWASYGYPVPDNIPFRENIKVLQKIPKNYLTIGLVCMGILGLIGLSFTVVRGYVRFKKTRYILREDCVIVKERGLFSYKETKLKYKHITHLRIAQSWLLYRVLKIGDILIDSAGSDKTEAPLRYLLQPDKIYSHLSSLLAKKGISLSTNEFLASRGAKPFRPILVRFFLYLTVALCILKFTHLLQWQSFLLVTLCLAIYSLYRYVKLASRKFRLYKDVVMAQEGPLSKATIIIPIQNICAASYHQDFIDALCGRGEIRLSCHGTSQGVAIKPIVRFKKLTYMLNTLLKKDKNVKIGKKTDYKDGLEETKDFITLDRNRAFCFTRILFVTASVFLLALFGMLCFYYARGTIKTESRPLWIMGSIVTILLAMATWQWIKTSLFLRGFKYYTTPENLVSEYKSLGEKKKLKFANDKISFLEIVEDSSDKLFKTCSMIFGSIGYEQYLLFQHIHQDNIAKIMDLLNLNDHQEKHLISSNVRFSDFIKAHLYFYGAGILLVVFASWKLFPILAVWKILLAVFLLFVLVLGGYEMASLMHKAPKIRFFEKYLLWEKCGLFSSRKIFVFYEWIKHWDIQYYPGSEQGRIELYVAGEFLSGEEDERVSKSISASYVDKIRHSKKIVDAILEKKPILHSEIASLESKPILERMPSAWHAFVESLCIIPGIFLFLVVAGFLYPQIEKYTPFILIVSVIIPIVWLIKKSLLTLYVLEEQRVAKYEGLIYLSERSVHFKDIDHINFRRNFWNKLLHTATIDIETVSSPKTELTIRNIPKFKEFYDQCSRRIDAISLILK